LSQICLKIYSLKHENWWPKNTYCLYLIFFILFSACGESGILKSTLYLKSCLDQTYWKIEIISILVDFQRRLRSIGFKFQSFQHQSYIFGTIWQRWIGCWKKFLSQRKIILKNIFFNIYHYLKCFRNVRFFFKQLLFWYLLFFTVFDKMNLSSVGWCSWQKSVEEFLCDLFPKLRWNKSPEMEILSTHLSLFHTNECLSQCHTHIFTLALKYILEGSKLVFVK